MTHAQRRKFCRKTVCALLCVALCAALLFTAGCSSSSTDTSPSPQATDTPLPTMDAALQATYSPAVSFDVSEFVAPTLDPSMLPSFFYDGEDAGLGPSISEMAPVLGSEGAEPTPGENTTAPNTGAPEISAAQPVSSTAPQTIPDASVPAFSDMEETIAATQPPESGRARPTPRPQNESPTVSSPDSGSSAGVASGAYKLDTSTANQGYIRAALNDSRNGYVRLQKSGGSTVDYPLKADGTWQSFSLTQGSGSYHVQMLQGLGGDSYRSMGSEDFSAQISNDNAVWLTSNPHIKWSDSMAPIQWAKENLTGSDADKVDKVYNLLVQKYDYDYDIVGKLPAGYLPNIEDTYRTKKGICYDFSSIFAAMLRSVGVPTKLVIGKCSNVNGLHSWNEVLLDGSWKIIDTSNDACYRMAGVKLPAKIKTSGYTAQKRY